jgi:dihydroneopterin aldolase/D-erythro-7,8-dihydroneopterin triphosphate epimerase
MDTIIIRNLRLRCIIGIQAWERHTRQDVRINIRLWVDLIRAGASDVIDDTVNYRTLTKQIVAMTESSSFQLVEALAEAIAAICLTDSRVHRTRVRVDKPGALRFADSVGVQIERDRAQGGI